MQSRRRKRIVYDAISSAATGEVYPRTAYADATTWCGFVRMNATEAETLACPEEEEEGDGGGLEAVSGAGSGSGGGKNNRCSVTPLLLAMKLMPATVSRLLKELERAARKKAEEIVKAILGEERRKMRLGWADEEADGRRRLEGEQEDRDDDEGEEDDFPKADLFLCPGVVDREYYDRKNAGTPNNQYLDPSSLSVTNAVTTWILSKPSSSGGDDDDGVSRSAAYESIYWTSTRAETMREESGEEMSERGEFWKRVLDLTSSGETADDCREFYETKLLWEVDLRPPTDFTVLTVTYNNTRSSSPTNTAAESSEGGETTDLSSMHTDDQCALALVAAMGTLPDVCALEIRPRAERRNSNAQWLVQSGVEGERPWFDAGLDGTGAGRGRQRYWDRSR